MDNKHFIWVVPMILVIGFVIGYISGLHIPKDISINVDNETLYTLRYLSDNNLKAIQSNSTINQYESAKEHELNTASLCEDYSEGEETILIMGSGRFNCSEFMKSLYLVDYEPKNTPSLIYG